MKLFVGSVTGLFLLTAAFVLSIGPINDFLDHVERSDSALFHIARKSITEVAAKQHFEVTELRDIRIERRSRSSRRDYPAADIYVQGTRNGEVRYWRLFVTGDYVAALKESAQPISSTELYTEADRGVIYVLEQ